VGLYFLLCVLIVGAPFYNYYQHGQGAFALEKFDSIKLESPYSKTVDVYKGQLHCHTTNSDGNQSPLEVVEAYKNAGYDFISITDHDYVTPDPRVQGILFITGNEVSSELGHISTNNVPSVTPSLNSQEVIDWTKAQEGLVWLAHPACRTNPWTTEEIRSVSGYNGIEVYNYGLNSYAEEKWDYVLTNLDYKITAIAVDDCHNIKKSNQFNGGWVMVFADSLTKASLLHSLKKGKFYSTQGPIINSVKVEGNTISIEMNQTSRVTWIGDSGLVLRETNGVTEDSYIVQGNEKYVRIRVECSGYAWTNPIYISRLSVQSASVSDSRVNPSQLITISGQVYYENTKTSPANRTAVQVYVNLNGENRAALSEIEDDGSFTFSAFPAESSVGMYNYNVYTVYNGQVSTQNQTVPVIVDGLKASTCIADLHNDQVQVRLLYAYDGVSVQNGTVAYAGFFARTDSYGWATFNLSDLGSLKWGLTAYAISEPKYGLTNKFQNQTVNYAKTTIETFTIRAYNPITEAKWDVFYRELGFNSSGTIITDVSDLGKPIRIEVNGSIYTDWTYDSATRQVTTHNINGRIVLQWATYETELWIGAAFSGGLTVISTIFLMKKVRGPSTKRN
jgi:hypothetical protein